VKVPVLYQGHEKRVSTELLIWRLFMAVRSGVFGM
jgi:hypothetical protein